jgi:predicted DNA-binding transcriptional regulator AlpA
MYSIVSGDNSTEIEPLMTIQEVCDWLGVCDSTLMRLRTEELLLPTISDGGLVRYLPSDVRAYLALQKEAARQALAMKQARRRTATGLNPHGPAASVLPTNS